MNIIEFYTNFENQLETVASKKRYGKVLEAFKNAPVSIDGGFLSFNTPSVGASNYVTIGAIIDSLNNREYDQFPVIPTKVLNVLDDKDMGLIFTSELYEPIRVGYKFLNPDGTPDDVNLFQVVSGNHRSGALILSLIASGYDLESENIRDVKVKVETCLYSVQAIIAGNGSRSQTQTEKKITRSSINNIDFDTVSLVKAIFADKIKFSNGFSLAFTANVVENQELNESLKLQRDTLASIASSFYNEIKNNKAVVVPSTDSGLIGLIETLTGMLQEAVNITKKSYTNIGRNPRVVASNLKTLYFDHLKRNRANKANVPATLTQSVAVESIDKAEDGLSIIEAIKSSQTPTKINLTVEEVKSQARKSTKSKKVANNTVNV